MAYSWAATFGEFQFERQTVTFKGSSQDFNGISRGSLGNILCNEIFEDGVITADIEFKDVDESSSVQLIFNYENQGTFICAGIGTMTMCEIRSFEGVGWRTHALVGDKKNIKKDNIYKLKVTVSGSLVTLYINSVKLLSYNLEHPLRKTHVGIWCQSKSDIVIKNYKVIKNDPKIFIVMPFKSPFNEIHRDIIKPACIGNSAVPVRVDESSNAGLIIGDILRHIYESKAIIADITEKNPNVYYEIGIAHALNKSSILIAKKRTHARLPFDISSFKVIFYEEGAEGKRALQESIKEHIKRILTN